LAGSSTSVPPVGGFSIEGLPEGDYRLRTTNNAGYVDTVVGGDSCTPEPCAISTGSLNNIAGADITGLSIQLSAGNTLPGIATVTTDTVDVPLPTGTADLFSSSGNLVKSVPVAEGLFTFRGVADGTYFLLIRNDLGLVDQLWAGIDCPAGSCDVATGTPIDVGAAPAAVESTSRLQSTKSSDYMTTAAAVEGTRLEFSLEQGTTVKGSVVTEGETAVQFVKVYIFDDQGDLAGEGITDGVGNFETDAGFPDGTWYAATQAPGTSGVGGGLTDEVYKDKTCAGDCDPVGQSATPIVTPGAAGEVHFVLGTGGRISGRVSSSTTTDPIAQVRINLFDDLGNPVAQTSTDGLGEYAFEGLLDGSYHLVASPQAGSFGAVLYDDLYCDGGCDVLTGAVVTLGAATSVGGIDFALPDDNCPNVDNTDQADSDYDGRGDACEGEPPVIHSKAVIDPTARIGDGVQVDQGVVVKAYAIIGADSILRRKSEIGEYCQLGENVIVEQSAKLGDHCSVGNGSYIGRSATLGSYVTVGINSIIGRDNRIEDHVVIGNNVELGPGVRVLARICIPDGTVIKKNTKVDTGPCP
jgi:carbonic anhydrase/acetyltransferase-like protein (isoleucine patch superfamily)